jgi:hypothetical protein
LDGNFKIVDWAGGRCEVKDIGQGAGDVHILGHVVVVEFKFRQREKVLDVLHFPRDQVVHANHVKPLPYEAVAEMRAQEAGSAGDEYARLRH